MMHEIITTIQAKRYTKQNAASGTFLRDTFLHPALGKSSQPIGSTFSQEALFSRLSS